MNTQALFKKRIIEVIRLIPCGKVMSYSQVAAYVGAPRAARQVGWVLRNLEAKINLPWWRVINNTGRITIKGNIFNNREIQKKLLEADGIIISTDFTLDIKKYRFLPSNKLLKAMTLSDTYIQMLTEKYSL